MEGENTGFGVDIWRRIRRLASLLRVTVLGVTVTLVPATMVLVACQGAPVNPGTGNLETIEGPTPEVASSGSTGFGVALDRIAYVNAAGNLFTIAPDGSDLRRLTGGVQAGAGSTGQVLAQPLNFEGYYAWPTWSPDGQKIAASRVQVAGEQSQISIEIIQVATSRAKTAYVNSSGGLVAQGAPHYLYWSPDSRYLAFIASTDEGLTLFVDDTETEDPPMAVESGAPLYFHWGQDSGTLLIHRGAEIKLAHPPFRESPRLLITSNIPFRVPALSPEGSRFAYIKGTGAGAALFVAPVASPENGSKLLNGGTMSALAWSPDGQKLAVADQLNPGGAVFKRLQIVSAADGEARTIGEGPILAFFWSPQGDQVAWVGLDVDARVFEWMLGGIAGEEPKRLFRFQPSSDVFTMLSFFDQYAYSHSPWALDGTQLVVAGTKDQSFGRQNGQTPTGDRIFVLEASGTKAPQDIAAGTLAFWSWN